MNKLAYWKRRQQGLRGQGDKQKPVFTPNPGEHMKMVPGKGLISMNRSQSRRKIVDHTMTRKGYRYGVRMRGGPIYV